MSIASATNMEDTLLSLIKTVHEGSGNTFSADIFPGKGIPGKKDEEYKYSPVARFLEKAIDGNPHVNGAEGKAFNGVKTHDGIRIVFENGTLQPGALDVAVEGVKFEKLVTATSFNHPSCNDPFQLINQTFFTDGVKVVVEENVQVAYPVEFVFYNTGEAGITISLPRIEIEVKKGASLDIIENFQYEKGNNCLIFPVIHSDVHKNARLKSYTLQMKGNNQVHVANTYVNQARDSYYKNVTISTSGKFIRNNHNLFLADENCESHLFGLNMSSGKDHIDNHTIVDHLKPNCYSNELYKGILKDESTGVFNGRIYVRPNAQQTNAFQSNNNILLSDKAAIHTKPQLEIWADDVKCSHGCTSGQLDEEALFYLRARGLDKQQATSLLLKAFSDDIVQHIEIKKLQELISEEVSYLL